ncbi:MAG: type II secretion system protein [Candidatus Moraniibacteriota bacterium]
MQKKKAQNRKGFTLLEILLVVAAIAILAGIVIVAINPSKQLGDTRDAQRRSDVNTILNAVYQYSIDEKGVLPTTIIESTTCDNTATKLICKGAQTGTCATGTVLSTALTTAEKYLVSLPNDPTGVTTNGTGYYIVKSANGRITVCAPSYEESGTMISVTR